MAETVPPFWRLCNARIAQTNELLKRRFCVLKGSGQAGEMQEVQNLDAIETRSPLCSFDAAQEQNSSMGSYLHYCCDTYRMASMSECSLEDWTKSMSEARHPARRQQMVDVMQDFQIQSMILISVLACVPARRLPVGARQNSGSHLPL